jgi:NTP pyrophosphatase (non-canonical NTP hydrolase)
MPELDETKPTLNMLHDAINQWGIDRNISAEGGATVLAQMSKMQEEFAEFLVTYDKAQQESASKAIYVILERAELIDESESNLLDIKAQLEDDFGDMLVCLIQAMRLAGTDMETCLAKAWVDIKDRRGTMVNGKFVKES